MMLGKDTSEEIEVSPWNNKNLPSIEIDRPDGTKQKVQFEVIETAKLQSHNHRTIEGITYDIPSDGLLNILLSIPNEKKEPIPLAALSIEIQEDGTPIITMIQKVKARIYIPIDDKDSLIKFTANLDNIEHPHKDLIQGQNKIPWQETLIVASKTFVTDNGFKFLRLKSGFHSKYGDGGHRLPMAVQQYDFLVRDQSEWQPMHIATGGKAEPITGESLSQLKTVIRKVRDKKYQSMADVQMAKTMAYNQLQIPDYWEIRLE